MRASDLGHGGTAAAPVSAARTAGVHGVQEFPNTINNYKEAVIGASPSPDGMGGLERGRTANEIATWGWTVRPPLGSLDAVISDLCGHDSHIHASRG